MNDNSIENKTSFWNFLEKYNIVIPIIQRDYAQGHQGKEYLRHNFLLTLFNALEDCENFKCNLDFVYGSIKNNIFYPLDGQQRLTTLWLLHWYIALKAGQLNDKNCKVLQKFSYETRITSRQFCKELCTPQNFENYADSYKIDDYIKDQTWFYNKSLQDPTIQSMLRMLGGTYPELRDGITSVFRDKTTEDFIKYWEKLTSEKEPPVSFYIFPLNNFSLSDDLYIKMNARGEQLTSFENFKADFINYIKENLDNPQNTEVFEYKKISDEIASKLDSDWTEIFWRNRSNKNSSNDDSDRKIDEIYFAFINRFFWNELFILKEDNDEYSLKIGKGKNTSSQENTNQFYRYFNNSYEFSSVSENDAQIAYKTLDLYKIKNNKISRYLVLKLKTILDNYKRYLDEYIKEQKGDSIEDFENDILKCPWQNDFWFIPKYVYEKTNTVSYITDNAGNSVLKITSINQIQRIAFFAICHYFSTIKDDIVPEFTSLRRWMRFVWNLISLKDSNGRYQIRNTEALRTTIELLEKYDCTDIYNSLSNEEINEEQSALDRQLAEERIKAQRILDEEDSNKQKEIENSIIEAESLAFFNGAIRFLFTGDNKVIDWDNFERRKANAKEYFDKAGVKDKYAKDAQLLKAYLYHVGKDYFWGTIVTKGLKVFDNRPETWLANILLFYENENMKEEKFASINAINKLLINNDNIYIPTEDLSRSNDGILYINIYRSQLLKLISHNYPKSRIRFYHNHYAIYPEGSWEAFVLDSNSYGYQCCRNQFISLMRKKDSNFELLDERTKKNSKYGFYYGWNIQFKYKGKDYQFDADKQRIVSINTNEKQPQDKVQENTRKEQVPIDGNINELKAIVDMKQKSTTRMKKKHNKTRGRRLNLHRRRK